MSTDEIIPDGLVVGVSSIRQAISKIDSQIKELENQREHNANTGEWNLVKAIKLQIGQYQRDKRVITRLLDFAEER